MAGYAVNPPQFLPVGTGGPPGIPPSARFPMDRNDLFFPGAFPGQSGAPDAWIRPGGGQSQRPRGLGAFACSVPGGTAPPPFGRG